MSTTDIILGDGVFSVGATAATMVDIALTRGGGKFTIERVYKTIEADSDYGPVKGRIRKIKSIAKLSLNALELLSENLPKLYPAMSFDTSDPRKDVMTGALDVMVTDYNIVMWTGKTLNGYDCIIELQNAINLENIEWNLLDKDEVVPEIVYTATYLEDARKEEPWKITIDRTLNTVTFDVTQKSDKAAATNVTVKLGTRSEFIDFGDAGKAVFTEVPAGDYLVTVTGTIYETYTTYIKVRGDMTQEVELVTG